MNMTLVPGAMLSWGGAKARSLISTATVVSVAGEVLLAGVVVSAGSFVSVGSFFAGRVVEFCTPVVFVSAAVWLGSWPSCLPFWTSWATAMAANTSTAITESGIAYISRFTMCPPPAYSHQRFLLLTLLLIGSRPPGPARLCKALRDAPMLN